MLDVAKKEAADYARWFIEYNPYLKCDKFGNKENHLKLEKLLHYANIAMLILHGQRIFKEEVVAYKEGFVVEPFYKEYRSNSIGVYDRQLRDDFTDEEINILTLINISFGKMTGFELSRRVHMDNIWQKYGNVSCEMGKHAVLDEEDAKYYYGQQEQFRDLLDYYVRNFEREKTFLDNIIVEKIDKSDNVFFSHDKHLELSEDDRKFMKCLSEDNGDIPETKYYYLYKNQDGILYVE